MDSTSRRRRRGPARRDGAWSPATKSSGALVQIFDSDVCSAPAELRCDLAQQAVEEVCVVVHPELVRNSQQEGVSGSDRLVLCELLDQPFRLPRVRLAESGNPTVQLPDLIPAPRFATEIRPIQVADDREYAAADRHSRLALMADGLPRDPVPLNLFGLELVERDPRVLAEQRRTHQVHA